ncbi:peptidoglycan-binding protein [Bradyrhizobium erythrophlei]|uniref:peptidoglycan-binding domain-containing protein n=1 Tax=Bradyrhizobium erythrophlei TaxID=1437360 RepID=UPI0035E8B912
MPIRASVGNGGRNQRNDVVYVQCLLDDWLVRKGLQAIDIDGIFGPETGQAILLFQQRMTRFSDGRIDPMGPTIKALEKAHLDGLLSGSWVGVAKQYGKPVARDPSTLGFLYDAYLRALQNGFRSDDNSIA